MALSDVIAAVRRLVQDEPWADTLSTAYTAGGATVSVTNPTLWEFGDVMDFPGASSGGSYEQMRVNDTASPMANPIDVLTGWNDTTNQDHASGAVVLKNPRYGTDQIAKAATHVVDNWLWPDLFVVTTTTITPAPTTKALYALPTDFGGSEADVVAIAQQAAGSITDVVYLKDRDYDVISPVPSSLAASTMALRVRSWPRTDVDATLFYRAKPTTTTMTSAMEPVIALGTAALLLKGESHEKADRPDEDDRPFRMLRASRELERAFVEEKGRLRAELLRRYGPERRRFLLPPTVRYRHRP